MLNWIRKKHLLAAIALAILICLLQGCSKKVEQMDPQRQKLIQALDKIINKTVDDSDSYHSNRNNGDAWERWERRAWENFLKTREEGQKLGLEVYHYYEAWDRIQKIVKNGDIDLATYLSSEISEDDVVKLALTIDTALVTDYLKTPWGRHTYLIGLACHYDEQKRWAIWALGKLGSPEAIAVLINSLATMPVKLGGEFRAIIPYQLKEYIIDILTAHGHTTVPQLIAKVDKKNPGHRWIKAAIMSIGDSRGIDILVEEFIQDLNNKELDDTAIYGLEETAIALSKASPFIMPKLIEAIHKSKGEYPLWHYAGDALGHIENPKTIEELQKAFTKEDAWIRENIAKALGNMAGNGSANSLARQALQDNDPRVRYYATESLGLINYLGHVHGLKKGLLGIKHFFVTPQEVKALIKATQDPDNDVRYKAVWSLGEIGSSKAISALGKVIESKDPYLREEATIALGKIKHSKALPWLKKAATDDNPLVREASIWAIGQIDTNLSNTLKQKATEGDTATPEGILVPGKNIKAYWRYHASGWGTEDWQIPFIGETTGRNAVNNLKWASASIESSDPYHPGPQVFTLSTYTMIARVRGEAGKEKIWLNFVDGKDYIHSWRGLIKLPPLPEGRAETIKIDFAKLTGRFNPDQLYQIVFNFGGMAWEVPLNPNGAVITFEDVKFIPNKILR